MFSDLDSFGHGNRDEERRGSRDLRSIEESSRPGDARSVRGDEDRLRDLARFLSVLGEERFEERGMGLLGGLRRRGRRGKSGEGDVRTSGLDVGRSVGRRGVRREERDDVVVVVGRRRLSSSGEDVGWESCVGGERRGEERGGLVGVSQRFVWKR